MVWWRRMTLCLALCRVLVFTSVLTVSVGCAPAAVRPMAEALMQTPDQPTGKLVYVRDGNLWIWEGGQARQLTTGGTWRQPAFAPSGAEIAYVFREQNFSDLFAMATDGSATRRLTNGQAAVVGQNDWAFRPAWSPDGSQIAYVSDDSSYFPVVWLMNRDGGAKRQVMNVQIVDAADAISWAPDAKRLAVTAMTVREPSQVYVLEVARGTVERLTSHTQGSFDPAWSPDGEVIAYIGRDGPRGDLWLRQVEGSEQTKSDRLSYVRSPVWSPDGKSLAVLSAQGGSFDVWVAPITREGGAMQIGEFRQLTRDGGIDATSGLSWAN